MDLPIVGILMDQIPEPGILIDLQHKSIAQVNGEIITITGFSQDELCSADLIALIRNINNIDIDQNEFQIELSRKNKEALLVQARAIQLDRNRKWALILLMGFKKSIDKNKVALSYVTKICNFSNDQTKEEYLKRVSKELENIYTNAIVDIYLTNQENNTYQKLHTLESKSIFPDIYTNKDIEIISTPEIWKPGKRVMNGFQRLARVNDFASLIICPMKNQNILSGFILISEIDQTISNFDLSSIVMINEIVNQVAASFDRYDKLNLDNLEKMKQNNLLNVVYDTIPAGVLLIKDNQIQQINSYAEKVLGYSKWEIKDISISDLFSGNENLVNIITNSKTKKELAEITLHQRDGVEIKVYLQIIPMQNSQPLHQKNEALVIFTDTTEIEKLQSKAKQLEQQALVGMMTAYFAHDVRNIINSIQIGADTSELRIKSGDIETFSMAGIKEDCDRITLLMESILSYSRSFEENMGPVDIVSFLQRLIDRLQPKLIKYNIKTIFQVESDIPLITGDIRSLEQVFSNLINNAKDAMVDDGGTLAININCEGIKNERLVTIKIADTGPGIPDDLLNKLFEPYMTTRISGTGLGLVISKQIILAHKGKIEVTSFPGGTTFKISLPEYFTE